MMRMKKLPCLLLVCAFLISSFSGCGKASMTEEKANDAFVNVTSTEIEETEAVQTISYEYEQDLNVIEDNYRNYYEVFVYSFYDSDGDGIGDLNGLTQKLDYIQEMGFNGIWLMPIMPSPTYHKYDVIDYYDIDPQYGTLTDFQTLLSECHKRGIRLIIDMVINHSSSKHEWFLEACKYLKTLESGQEPNVDECPYVDYYHFATEQIDGTYYRVPGTDYFYEGSFWSEMPDLNLESDAVRTEIENIAKYWIDMGVDGFRMDAAMHYSETDVEENIDVLNRLFQYCKEINPEFYMVSEVWAAKNTIETYYQSQTPSFFNFPNSSAEGILEKTARGTAGAAKLVQTMLDDQQRYSAAYEDYIDASFLTNHDQVRVANNLQSNVENLKMACGLLSMLNGSIYVYYGEEIGMKSSGTADENKRKAMYWSSTDSTGITKNPSGADSKECSSLDALDVQQEDKNSLLNYYKRAMRIRNENPEIARGTIALVEELCVDKQAAITKTYEGSVIGIVYNTDKESVEININGTDLAEMNIRGYLTSGEDVVTLKDGKLFLPAQSICILK